MAMRTVDHAVSKGDDPCSVYHDCNMVGKDNLNPTSHRETDYIITV